MTGCGSFVSARRFGRDGFVVDAEANIFEALRAQDWRDIPLGDSSTVDRLIRRVLEGGQSRSGCERVSSAGTADPQEDVQDAPRW
jgi:hypothetical protein